MIIHAFIFIIIIFDITIIVLEIQIVSRIGIRIIRLITIIKITASDQIHDDYYIFHNIIINDYKNCVGHCIIYEERKINNCEKKEIIKQKEYEYIPQNKPKKYDIKNKKEKITKKKYPKN